MNLPLVIVACHGLLEMAIDIQIHHHMDITDRWPLLWSIFSIITSLLFVTRCLSCVKIKILTRKLKNGIESKEIVSRELKALEKRVLLSNTLHPEVGATERGLGFLTNRRIQIRTYWTHH